MGQTIATALLSVIIVSMKAVVFSPDLPVFVLLICLGCQVKTMHLYVTN